MRSNDQLLGPVFQLARERARLHAELRRCERDDSQCREIIVEQLRANNREIVSYAAKPVREGKPRPSPVATHGPRPGLGDYTEQVLALMGVTKERWVEAKQLFGGAPSCACDARKEWMNKVGRYFGIGVDDTSNQTTDP